jgi:hypothetical protein
MLESNILVTKIFLCVNNYIHGDGPDLTYYIIGHYRQKRITIMYNYSFEGGGNAIA